MIRSRNWVIGMRLENSRTLPPLYSVDRDTGVISELKSGTMVPMERDELAVRVPSKKIAEGYVGGGTTEGVGDPCLPRSGKAQELVYDAAGTRIAQDGVGIYSGHHSVTARDGSTAFCDIRYCKFCASTEGEWKQRSADICGTCGAVHVADGIYNHNFVRQSEAFRLHENKLEGVGGGEKIVAEGSANEAGTATGKDRRNSETVQEGNDGGKSPAVGVGKSKVNIQALRDICAGKLPDIETVIAKHEGIAEQTEYSPDPHEVDLCGFESYNEIDGENYVCGKEKHGPKVKHGEWIQI